MLQRPEFNTAADITLWLGSQNPAQRFDWQSADGCACAQYVKARYSGAQRHTQDNWAGAIGELNNVLGKYAVRKYLNIRATMWLTFGEAADEWERYCRFFDRPNVDLTEDSMTDLLVRYRNFFGDRRVAA